ncbi:MAG: RNA polymerase sigma factor [Bacteroidota bacterium]
MRPSTVNDQESDLQIISEVIGGDKSAYADLVDKYKSYAYSLAYRILNNQEDAEEAAQDAFIKAYHALPKFGGQSKFSTWLYRIVFNTAISYKRKQKHYHDDIEVVHSKFAGELDSSAEKNDRDHFIHLALGKLLPTDAAIITLFYLKEHSLEEISEIMGTKTNTVKVKLFRARKRLAEELKRILKHEAVTL